MAGAFAPSTEKTYCDESSSPLRPVITGLQRRSMEMDMVAPTPGGKWQIALHGNISRLSNSS
jgi:hypothetical protein